MALDPVRLYHRPTTVTRVHCYLRHCQLPYKDGTFHSLPFHVYLRAVSGITHTTRLALTQAPPTAQH